MMRRVFLPAACFAFVLASCGGDNLPTGTNSGDQLSTAETQELTTALFVLISNIDVNIPGPFAQRLTPGLFLSVTSPISDSYNATEPCDGLSGNATVNATLTGDYDQASGEGNAKVEGTVDFTACRLNGDAAVYTIDGDPELGVTADFQIHPASVSASVVIRGGVRFTTADDRAGTCAVDVTVTANVSAAGVSETVTGSVCGVNAATLNVKLFDDTPPGA